MSKYRKLYNANLLGTSDISILKFYFASYKLQQQKGKVSDIDQFLDLCADIASETSVYAKILGILPFVTTSYSAELKRIAKFIRLRREAVKELFLKDNITDLEIRNLLYGISDTPDKPNTSDILDQISKPSEQNQMELVKEKILKCNSINGKMQLGDRIFGYLLKAEIIDAHTPEDRLKEWNEFLDSDVHPSDVKLLANPALNRSKNKDDTTSLQNNLEVIHDFYKEIGLQKVAKIIKRDLKKLGSQ
jgi:hypothetical protein